MGILRTIQPYMPPILFNRIEKIRNKHRKLHLSPLPHILNKTDKMILIGNGPSLTKSIELYKDEILKYDRLVVNYFALSDQYEVLRPNFYLFVDPAFFMIPENQKDSIARLIDAIASKTTWKMRLCAPEGVEDTPMVKAIKANTNIEFVYFYKGVQTTGELSKFEVWDRNLCAPPCQNSLNTGLYLSLFWEYKEIYMIGVDMSSLEDIRVDQETNELFSIDTHFYSNKQVYTDQKLFDAKRGRIRADWTLHDYIYAFGKMFEDFYELSKYADYKGLKVYNASEYSWINCFERRKLIEYEMAQKFS